MLDPTHPFKSTITAVEAIRNKAEIRTHGSWPYPLSYKTSTELNLRTRLPLLLRKAIHDEPKRTRDRIRYPDMLTLKRSAKRTLDSVCIELLFNYLKGHRVKADGTPLLCCCRRKTIRKDQRKCRRPTHAVSHAASIEFLSGYLKQCRIKAGGATPQLWFWCFCFPKR